MTTTVSQNTAHRVDPVWVKSKGSTFRVDDENYLSEYLNQATDQAIRKGWRMTGQDWFVFDAQGAIVGRSHSLTWAKIDAAAQVQS